MTTPLGSTSSPDHLRTVIPKPARSAIAEHELADYDALSAMFDATVDGDRYPGSEVFGALMNSPSAARAIVTIGTTILGRDDERIPQDFHQFGDMVVCAELLRLRGDRTPGCELRVMYNHLQHAIQAGVRPEAIRAVLAHNDEELTAEETLCATFARGIVHGEMTDQTLRAMEQRLGRRCAIEYGLLMLLVVYLTRAEDFVGCAAPTMADIEAQLHMLTTDTSEATVSDG